MCKYGIDHVQTGNKLLICQHGISAQVIGTMYN